MKIQLSLLFLIFFLLAIPVQKGVSAGTEQKNWQEEVDFSTLEKDDDLVNLKNDLGVDLDYLNEDFEKRYLQLDTSGQGKKEVGDNKENPSQVVADQKKGTVSPKPSDALAGGPPASSEVFDVGAEEKELLRVATLLEHRMNDQEWNDLASKTHINKYEVVAGDYLWKISRKLFGTGFYYSKIWSLNPYITNPHLIEPSMVLVFDSGDSTSMPQVQVGHFEGDGSAKKGEISDLGDGVLPPWFKERDELLKKGSFFQYASDSTYEDIKTIGDKLLNKEYERYIPPLSGPKITIPEDEYDESGISRDSKIRPKFKEGLSLTTFVTSNLVQDLGEIEGGQADSQFFHPTHKIYVRFHKDISISPGDYYSIYSALGEVSHANSERSGYKYIITGEIKVLRSISDLYECEITRQEGTIQRGDRITVHTPSLPKIVYTFNDRSVEGIVIAGYSPRTGFSQGDVVYLDRGRSDGLEVGNVFEFYGFRDNYTKKRLTLDPTYKIGEGVVLTLTDNFATLLIHSSSMPITLGGWAVTKSKEAALMVNRVRNKNAASQQSKALEHLDVELSVDNMNKDLLKKADSIQLTEDELAELERQEKEKSFIEHNQQDIKELERLEKELSSVEQLLLEKKQDEDKLLEKENLNTLEQKAQAKASGIYQSMNEIESKVGKKYIDEKLGDSDNPFGLSKSDVEEIDELLGEKTKSVEEQLAKPRQEATDDIISQVESEAQTIPDKAEGSQISSQEGRITDDKEMDRDGQEKNAVSAPVASTPPVEPTPSAEEMTPPSPPPSAPPSVPPSSDLPPSSGSEPPPTEAPPAMSELPAPSTEPSAEVPPTP